MRRCVSSSLSSFVAAQRVRQAREEAAAAEAEEDGPDHETEQVLFAARHAGRQGRATIVGTASYEHTLMRCERDLLAQTAQAHPLLAPQSEDDEPGGAAEPGEGD